MKSKVVVALGGNAILPKGSSGSAKSQLKAVSETVKHIKPLFKKFRVVLTHGNGPQVGSILLQQEKASNKVPAMPLDVCGAESQGLIGYFLQQSLRNAGFKAVTLATQVLVDKKDPSFKRPSKFVGPFYSRAQVARLKSRMHVKPDPHGGFRRVVASPVPREIVELGAVKASVDDGFVVIACGGGGIPVVKQGKKLSGVEAVIDKDLCAAVLAHGLRADLLLIITDVDSVYLDFGSSKQRSIRSLGVKTAKKLLKVGQFPAGSMGPKIEAAVKFLEKGGKKVVICDIKSVEKALKGKAGTVIEG